MAASSGMRLLVWRKGVCGFMPRCCLQGNAKIFHTSSTVFDTDIVQPSMISPKPKSVSKAEKISRAMRAYLERGKAYDTMMSKEWEQYETGKRHLARIMGEDPDSFSQQDIDSSIQYLLPSGLYHKGAKPKMKPPSEVFPLQKAVQFDKTGRPYHTLFYTGKPNYYQIVHDAAVKFDNLNELEERLHVKGINVPPESDMILELKQTTWLDMNSLEKIVIEKVDENELRRFQIIMERLSHHPLAHREREFIMRFRKPVMGQNIKSIAPEIQVDEDQREFCIFSGSRKDAKATVKLWIKGTGQFTVNGVPHYQHFPLPIDREQLFFPLQFLDKIGRVDVEAMVTKGGSTGQAGAIRHALSTCFMSFSDADTIEQLRIAGLLTRDPRKRERKKPGQPKARKKNTWKKR